MRISDCSSYVCSSDLIFPHFTARASVTTGPGKDRIALRTLTPSRPIPIFVSAKAPLGRISRAGTWRSSYFFIQFWKHIKQIPNHSDIFDLDNPERLVFFAGTIPFFALHAAQCLDLAGIS